MILLVLQDKWLKSHQNECIMNQKTIYFISKFKSQILEEPWSKKVMKIANHKSLQGKD